MSTSIKPLNNSKRKGQKKKVSLIILINAIHITPEQAKRCVEPPYNLPVETCTTPVKLASLGSRHLVPNHAAGEPLDDGKCVENALHDGLLRQEGLLGGEEASFACGGDASAEDAVLLADFHGLDACC